MLENGLSLAKPFPSANNVDVIKIDVEGAELFALRGGKNLIKTNRPIIMFESGPSNTNEFGLTKEALWQFFNELNYGVHIPNRVGHNDSGLIQEGFIESHIYPRRTTNDFAIPEERRLEVRDRARELLGVSVD
ncbi:MAG: FkbM family methyltransferase [Microcystaceae cyanobacterium]